MSTTRVPDAVDALLAAFTAALPGVQVLDGPRTEALLDNDVAIVGISASEDVPTVEVALTQTGLGPRQNEEFYVSCELSTWHGAPDMRTPRVRCGEMLAAIDTQLRADRRLGGVVLLATLGPTLSWEQRSSDDGAGCAVQFTVRCQAAL